MMRGDPSVFKPALTKRALTHVFDIDNGLVEYQQTLP